METLLESIRVAIANDASDDARAAGVQACRTILTALDAKPGDVMALATVPAVGNAGNPAENPSPIDASSPTAQIANMLGALRGVPAEQLLDLAIARLRAALPAGAEPPRAAPVKFQIIQLPKARR